MEAGMIIGLLKIPAVQAVLIKFLLDKLHDFLVAVENQKLLEPYKKHLNAILLICTFLTTIADAALSGHLSALNLDNARVMIETFIQMLVTSKAWGVINQPPAPKK